MKTGYDVILRPIITENSMDMAAEKKYAFKVAADANKTEVRKAIEEIFGVDVAKVNILNVSGKRKRLGRNFGTTSSYKKALIVMDEKDDNVVRSAHNIPGVRTALVSTMNVYEIVNHYTLVLTEAAAKKIEEVYA